MSLTSILEYISSFVGVKRLVILVVRWGLITDFNCIVECVVSGILLETLLTWMTVLSTVMIMILGIFTEIFMCSEVL
nr:MAG TPA: hypothetical protein [Caudoviricetes sp.]